MCGWLLGLSISWHTNWIFGWGMILSAFVAGAVLGLFFYRENFLGGYSSFSRRIVRLGHISLAAIGMLNVLYGLTPAAAAMPHLAGIGLILGGITMPAVCLLTGWRAGFRHLFFIPVTCLVVGVGSILYGAIL
jgi:hypothetical protein